MNSSSPRHLPHCHSVARGLPLAGLLAAMFCPLAPAVASSCSPSNTSLAQSVTIAKVVDGDTLKLTDGRRVRLAAINTPEKARPNQLGQPLANEATQAAKQWAERGSATLYIADSKADKHDRVLGYVFVAGKSLAEELIEQGLAARVAKRGSLMLDDCLQWVERRARTNKRGIWSGHPFITTAKLLDTGSGGFHIVRGKINKIIQKRSGTVLVLDHKLSVYLRTEVFEQLPFKAAVGRTIEARGWLVPDRKAKRPDRWWLNVSDRAAVELRG